MAFSDGNTLNELSEAFSERIAELKRYSLLRLEDSSKDYFQQELRGLEATVGALEQQIRKIRHHIAHERAVVPQVELLLVACKAQDSHLQVISSNLPQRLPSISVASASEEKLQSAPALKQPSAVNKDAKQPGDQAHARARMPKDVPRWYLMDSELQSLSSYMRGRLTLDKINAAIDEAAVHAEGNQRLIATLRQGGGAKMAPAERKRATDLMHCVAAKDSIKGSYWLLDTDLKEGTALKRDKTGQAILTILRHLGRMQEVRLSIEGVPAVVYVLHAPSTLN